MSSSSQSPQAVAADRLFESDNLVVKVCAASDTSRWVITFDNYGIGHGFDRAGFGEAFLAEHGISALHVMGCREDWYQYPEIFDALEAVRKFTSGAHRVITYGSSMGGYAAIRFAARSGADLALALSPQYSIDPRRAPFETRWLSDSRRIRFLREADGKIRSNVRTLVAFDPRTADGLHVDLIKRDISIEELRAPYTGHPVATFLSETGILRPLVLCSLDGSIAVDSARLAIRSSRGSSSVYYASLSNYCTRRSPDRAIRFSRRAVELKPDSPLALLSLARALLASGDVNGAIATCEKMVALSGRDYHYLVPLADALSAAGRYEEALIVAREAVAMGDNMLSPNLNAWVGLIASSAGRREEARTALMRAHRLDPHNAKYIRALSRLDRGDFSSVYSRVKSALLSAFGLTQAADGRER